MTAITTSASPALDEMAQTLAAALTPVLGRRDGPIVVALLPAHNEAASIAVALDSLHAQSRPADLVVVVADNCTDATVEVVQARADAIAISTVGNVDKKAGALNQALTTLLPLLDGRDAVLVMDADSALDPHFLDAAMRRLGTSTARRREAPRMIGGVGGAFSGGRGGGFVGMLQRNEYARYARDIRRLSGRVLVLTGTAAVFRADVLRHVVAARASGELPGAAQVYDTSVLTEDNELTLALLHLGYGILSPSECLLETEVMTSWRELWHQRVRWKRGALENLLDYGFTRVTWRYWGRQVLLYAGVVVTGAYLGSVLLSLVMDGTVRLHPIWLAVTAVFMLERAVSVRSRGWMQVVLASLLVVEMFFDVFLQGAQLAALWKSLRKADRAWR